MTADKKKVYATVEIDAGEFGVHDHTVEVSPHDFEQEDLFDALLEQSGNDPTWMFEQLDKRADSWEFTRKIRDWAVAEMAKHEEINYA